MKNRKKLIALCLLMFSVFLVSCEAAPDPGSVLTESAEAFGDGKQETDYAFLSNEEILNHLIDEFAGSRSEPQGSQMSGDEKQKIDDSADEDNAIGLDGTVLISSGAELKKALHQMFDETKEVLNFQCAGGYRPDINELTEIVLELEREDAFDVICLDRYSLGGQPTAMTISLKYHLDVETLRDMKEETRTLLADAKEDFDVSGLSDYEIVCEVNDYLCDKIVYPEQEPYAADSHTAYSAFKKGSAVCDGYARAAKMLLNEFGIECDFVVGNAGGGHAWNLVKLDGNWYHMDVTWNDGGAKWDRNARTAYLLVTDDYMKQSRVWDYSIYPATPKKAYR